MTNKELNKALYDKCDKEYDAFIDEMNQAFQDRANSRYKLEHGDEFLSEYAYQYIMLFTLRCTVGYLHISNRFEKRRNDRIINKLFYGRSACECSGLKTQGK